MALSISPILKLFDSEAFEFVVGKGKLVRNDLISELSAESKNLENLCSAFVERAHQVPCIISFYEENKLRGSVVSAHYCLVSAIIINFDVPEELKFGFPML